MRGLRLTLLAINLFTTPVLAAQPLWLTNSPTQDEKNYLVVCSADSLDPEEAEQAAQSRCMASAAKLSGVSLEVQSKTIDSTTGADASEVVKMKPLQSTVQCNWKDRFMEPSGEGFRVWLRCAVDKSTVKQEVAKSSLIQSAPTKLLKSGRAVVTVACWPPPETVIVDGERGERVINPLERQPRIELREGDQRITVRYHGYQDLTKDIPQFHNGDSLTMSFKPVLED